MTYKPQLDGLRAIAIALVLVDHALPPGNALGALHLGDAGVRLFFVLSGFLITGILLRAREESGGLRALLRFEWRRVLRIFPPYYAAVGALWLAGAAPVVAHPGVFFGYGVNWWFLLDPSAPSTTDTGFVAHFWSLAVEEQFYLAWPLLFLFLPRRFLPAVIGGAIGGAVLWRAGVVLVYQGGLDLWAPSVALSWATPACMDCLGLGAALALWPRARLFSPRIACAALVLYASIPLGGVAHIICGPALLGIAFAGLVRAAAKGRLAPLQHPALVAVGRVSYGVYLYHLPAMWALKRCGAVLVRHGLAFGLFQALVALIVAAISWRLLERPLAKWKALVD